MQVGQPIKIAILAMGGEGGGVLADWLVSLGEAHGWHAQATSVPGVAQRTGATIYYVELMPGADRPGARPPVLALMPLPGDVDLVLCSELMEAGRAVQRGLVTADRTVLITSTHRVHSIAEKMSMGDGRVDAAALTAHARHAARRWVAFDMAATVERSGSVISAVLFGALAATGELPFAPDRFEATIRDGGLGVTASLKAFAEGFRQALGETLPSTAPDAGTSPRPPVPPRPLPHAGLEALRQRVSACEPPALRALVTEGVRRLIDYQDPAYAAFYLDRLDALQRRGSPADLLSEAARHLALWMSYEDTIRVADLKTRAERFTRVRGELRLQAGQRLSISEFLHPRMDEVCETLPAPIGRWLAQPHAVHRMLARFTREGRQVRTSSLGGFLLLWGLSRWRVGRRSTWRYQIEQRRIEAWWQRVGDLLATQPALALEVVKCQRLVKGYGDTHARGWRHFEALMDALDRAGPAMPPERLAQLRDAALADEQGDALKAALASDLAAMPVT